MFRKSLNIIHENQNMKSIFVFILTFGIFISCAKSPKCWGKNKVKGIIENSLRIDCIPTSDQQEFVITTESEYQQVFVNLISGDYNCSLPEIDFNSNSLLGLHTKGACKTKYIREVTHTENEQQYHYKVIIKNCGICKKEGFSYNWVTIPKIIDGSTVTFETVNK